jgi:hypothetical protein
MRKTAQVWVGEGRNKGGMDGSERSGGVVRGKTVMTAAGARAVSNARGSEKN